jgi:large subunit ribosomal protein L1
VFIGRLGIDPRKGDQTVRGTCELPNSNGKKQTILFVCTNEEIKQKALKAGADMVITKEILEDVGDL